MFENIIFGPICVSYNMKDRQFHFKEIAKNGYHPIVEVTKGELFEEVELSTPNKKKMKSIILCIAYKKLYKG